MSSNIYDLPACNEYSIEMSIDMSTKDIVGKNKELVINKKIIENREVKFGPRTQYAYLEDPKHLLFNLSRYKFVSKMFSGYKSVLEIGCGDAFGTALVAQTVEEITATDLDKRFVIELKRTHAFSHKINFIEKRLTKIPAGI